MSPVSQEEVEADMTNFTSVVLDPITLWNETELMDECEGQYEYWVTKKVHVYLKYTTDSGVFGSFLPLCGQALSSCRD